MTLTPKPARVLRVAMPGADWGVALILAGLTVATRWPYRARLLPTWDAVQFALANGIPVDLDVVLDGCQRAIDDLDTWAEEDVKEPLLRLREELLRLQGEQ